VVYGDVGGRKYDAPTTGRSVRNITRRLTVITRATLCRTYKNCLRMFTQFPRPTKKPNCISRDGNVMARENGPLTSKSLWRHSRTSASDRRQETRRSYPRSESSQQTARARQLLQYPYLRLAIILPVRAISGSAASQTAARRSTASRIVNKRTIRSAIPSRLLEFAFGH
jgi:hypothetical protein